MHRSVRGRAVGIGLLIHLGLEQRADGEAVRQARVPASRQPAHEAEPLPEGRLEVGFCWRGPASARAEQNRLLLLPTF